MQMQDVSELKEALNVGAANQALAEGWQLVAVVTRGSQVVYVLGKKKLSGMAAAIANARTIQPVEE